MTLEEVIAEYEKRFDCTKCRYKWTCKKSCTGSWALDYLKDLKSYVMGEQSKIAAFGKRLSDNVAVLPEGVYCNVCGTRLDLEEDDDEDAG